ncbi:uncharacterized protein FN964_012370 isoform 2-T3 [Alca torda]
MKTQVEKLRHRTVTSPVYHYAGGTELDCLKDLMGGIEYAAKILNEIPQKDIQCTKRASKAEREGNGQVIPRGLS